MRLRKFAPATLYLLENLMNKEITLTNPNRFNDALDCYFLRTEKYLTQLEKFRDELSNLKISCFVDVSKKTASTDRLLWAYYANAHQGLCLEFEIERLEDQNLFGGEVNYSVELIENFEDFFSSINTESFQSILEKVVLSKDKAFMHEKEYRLCYIDQTPFGLQKCIFRLSGKNSLWTLLS